MSNVEPLFLFSKGIHRHAIVASRAQRLTGGGNALLQRFTNDSGVRSISLQQMAVGPGPDTAVDEGMVLCAMLAGEEERTV